MPPPVDPSRDYLLTEQPEDVTYSYQISEGVFSPQFGALVHYAKGFDVDKSTALGSEQLWQNGRVFQIWKIPMQQAGLVLRDPKNYDKIVDKNGAAWRIQKTQIVSLGWRFRLTCLREVS